MRFALGLIVMSVAGSTLPADPPAPLKFLEALEALQARARGEIAFGEGDLDKALEEFNQAVRLDPTSAAVFNNRAICWRLKGQLAKARKDHDEAVRLGPNTPRIYASRAATWLAAGEWDKAIKDYDEVLRLSPDDTDTYLRPTCGVLV